MDICKMCVHRMPAEGDDNFKCNKKCDEYIEFVALPIYEAAPDMYEALKALVQAFDKLAGGLPDATFTDPYFLMFNAIRKAEGREG